MLAEQHYGTLRSINERLVVNVEQIQRDMALLTMKVPPPTNAELEPASVWTEKRAQPTY